MIAERALSRVHRTWANRQTDNQRWLQNQIAKISQRWLQNQTAEITVNHVYPLDTTMPGGHDDSIFRHCTGHEFMEATC